jgi:hypothetical protein
VNTLGKCFELTLHHQGNITAESIMRIIIKHSDFTADELNTIQPILDVKI